MKQIAVGILEVLAISAGFCIVQSSADLFAVGRGHTEFEMRDSVSGAPEALRALDVVLAIEDRQLLLTDVEEHCTAVASRDRQPKNLLVELHLFIETVGDQDDCIKSLDPGIRGVPSHGR